MKDWIHQKGAWIMIIKNIPVEIPIPLFSIWYAMPTNLNFLPNERTIDYSKEDYNYRYKNLEALKSAIKIYNGNRHLLEEREILDVEEYLKYNRNLDQQVKIKTPFGFVNIQPEEYNVVNDLDKYFELLDTGDAQMKHLSVNKTFKGKLSEQLFYCRSRGISLPSALALVSGNISTQNAFYLLMHPEYRRNFDRYFDKYQDKENAYKEKVIKNNSDNINYFFDEEAALKLNQKRVSV